MGYGTDKLFSGKWEGQYTYGPSYGTKLTGKSVPFTLLLQVEGSGKVTGECLDDGYADQIDAKAIIEGTILNGRIEFVKKYRHYWATNDDGTTALENKKRESHEIHYSGEYRQEVFTGEWKIFTVFLHTDGTLVERYHSGYWIMHQVK